MIPKTYQNMGYQIDIIGINYIKHNEDKIEIFNLKVKSSRDQSNEGVSSRNWDISRLLNQFILLSNDLKSLNFQLSGLIGPQVKFLNRTEKIQILQNFLNECLQNPLIVESEVFKQFIGVVQEKNIIQKLKSPKNKNESITRGLHSRTKSAALFLNQPSTISQNISKLEKSSIVKKSIDKKIFTKVPTPSIQEAFGVPYQHLFSASASTKNLILMTKSNTITNSTLYSKSGINTTSNGVSTNRKKSGTSEHKIKNQKQSFAQKKSFNKRTQSSNKKQNTLQRETIQQMTTTCQQTLIDPIFTTIETPREFNLNQNKVMIKDNQVDITLNRPSFLEIQSVSRQNPHDSKQNSAAQGARTKSQTNDLNDMLIEEQKILEQKRKRSQEPKLDESGELELLTFNEYMANAKIARKLKKSNENTRKQSPIDYKQPFLQGFTQKQLQNQMNSQANNQINAIPENKSDTHNKMSNLVSNLIQKTIGAKRQQNRQHTDSPQSQHSHQDGDEETEEFNKRFNPTVLMKNQSMKEHFKKQRRQNIYENLVNDQQNKNNESDEQDCKRTNNIRKSGSAENRYNAQLTKIASTNITRLTGKGSGLNTHRQKAPGQGQGLNVYNIQKDRKIITYMTPSNDTLHKNFFKNQLKQAAQN
ncbi:UNKNOWN [Stylonychia lemnae]|uniref:PX domain-containing protein n=1 Tax=Stylonychia lemnae TaxID=5949 RepID=A0A078A5H3_STYLE|nr:UNKNOWN [Stylonychia lemnae]|eukprot:CDW77424.1 UNKNOWN [Stylonychia lemnae]